MALTSEGNAAPGFPLSGAALIEAGTSRERLVLISRNLDPTRYALINTSTWTVDQTISFARGDGAWGTCTASDGAYIGLFGARGQGNILRIDGPTGAKTLNGRALIDTTYVWDLAAGSAVIYGVATHPTITFSVNRSSGQATDLRVATTDAERPRTVAVVGNRVVFAGARSGSAWLRHTNASGGDARDALPPAIGGDDVVYCSAVTGDGRVVLGTGGAALNTPAIVVLDLAQPDRAMVVRLPREALVDTVAVDGTVVYATARPSGALYRLDLPSGSLSRRAVPMPMSETRELFVTGQGLVGASADGSAWVHDPGTGSTTRHTPTDMGLVGRPQRAQSILAAAGRTDVGGSFSVTRHDLSSGVARSVFVPGEPKAMVDVDGTSYLAMYPIAEIWRWPAGGASPARLTQLPSDQLRPIDLVYAPQLDALVVSSTDDLTVSGLHTVDPVTGRVDTVRNPLGPGQVASGLHVQGTTVYMGGSGANPALVAYDLMDGKREWLIANAIPGGSFVLGLAVVGGHLICSTADGWLARVDLATRSVAQRRKAASTAGRMAVIRGRVMLATADSLLEVNPATLATTVRESGLGAKVWGWPPLDGDPQGRAWLIRGRELVRTQPL